MPNQWFSKTFDWDSPIQRIARSAFGFAFGQFLHNMKTYDNYMMSYYRNERT